MITIHIILIQSSSIFHVSMETSINIHPCSMFINFHPLRCSYTCELRHSLHCSPWEMSSSSVPDGHTQSSRCPWPSVSCVEPRSFRSPHRESWVNK
jgi:hypothetical protein